MAANVGEYIVAIDAKGRFLLPSAFRKQLAAGQGGRFVVNRGFEKCVTMYLPEVWDKYFTKINALNDFKAEVRKFKRLFLNGATEVETDSADRLLIPRQLLEYAGIDPKKDAVMSVQGKKIELWDKDTFYKYLDDNAEDFSQLADDMSIEIGNPFEEKEEA